MLIESDQRAQRAGIDALQQDRRAWTIAGIAAVRVLALPSAHQSRALREHVEQQLAMVLGKRILAFDRADELDRHRQSALMKKLEDGVLRIGTGSAPSHG